MKGEDILSEIILVVLLGIVEYKGKILIVRRENDPLVKELKWCLPGGSLEPGKKVEACLKEKIKNKVGLNVSIQQLLFTRIPKENNFLLYYFYCKTKSEKIKLKEEFVEAKWIEPKEFEKYFTTSVDERLVEFLSGLD
jgi:ADP-ribose pyrophosphatase YjhB (NUDIX family)